jgi:hypothetical protein
VTVSTDNAEPLERRPSEDMPLEELARRKGVKPVESLHDMVRLAVFESDEELEAFLAHVSVSRHADLA